MLVNHHAALIYTMVLVSAADRNMTDAELQTIGEIVRHLPVFQDFDVEELAKIASSCVDLVNADDGLEKTLERIHKALPPHLCETAYALACDVAVSDARQPSQEVLRLLELVRHRLGVERLVAAAIERGARARYSKL
ncbi:MAG: tellurite resistance TerB family protein [Proteobacteria bacterium]|nr:tellurite resistance TerB family protein [Pseudomonadota bacterium]